VPKPDTAREERVWTDPVDSTDPKDANLILAERVAQPCATWSTDGSLPVEVDGAWMRRPVTPATS
jgi:hypothetical protein